MRITRLLLPSVAGLILLSSCARKPVKPTVQPFKVAFVGDTGFDSTNSPVLDTGFEKVLDLVKSEDAQMLAIAGDFGYEEVKNVATGYFENIDRILGEDFPIVAADGNHDDWSQYMPFFQERLERMGLPDTLISGEEYGLHFGGIDWVMLGTHGDAGFVKSHLPGAGDGDWRVCLWHKNMNDMQAGGKSDEMDWATYRACQDAGAIIATGHEHSYARTRTLADLGNVQAGHGVMGPPDHVEVGPGRTFVFVSGLGGKSMRDYECDKHEDDTWWATVYTSNYYLRNGEEIAKSCAQGSAEADPVVDGYTFGALFITLQCRRRPGQGRCLLQEHRRRGDRLLFDYPAERPDQALGKLRKLVDEYNAYNPVDTLHVNGALTLSAPISPHEYKTSRKSPQDLPGLSRGDGEAGLGSAHVQGQESDVRHVPRQPPRRRADCAVV